MALLPRPVTMMIWSQPAAIASSTPYWMIGLSMSGSISFGCALVAGKKRVPNPATGKTALRTFFAMNASCLFIYLQRRRVLAQHHAPHEGNRRRALLHELVVELLERKTGAHFLPVVGPQLHDLQLAQRIDEVCRVRRATFRLALRHRRCLVAFL